MKVPWFLRLAIRDRHADHWLMEDAKRFDEAKPVDGRASTPLREMEEPPQHWDRQGETE